MKKNKRLKTRKRFWRKEPRAKNPMKKYKEVINEQFSKVERESFSNIITKSSQNLPLQLADSGLSTSYQWP